MSQIEVDLPRYVGLRHAAGGVRRSSVGFQALIVVYDGPPRARSGPSCSARPESALQPKRSNSASMPCGPSKKSQPRPRRKRGRLVVAAAGARCKRTARRRAPSELRDGSRPRPRSYGAGPGAGHSGRFEDPQAPCEPAPHINTKPRSS